MGVKRVPLIRILAVVLLGVGSLLSCTKNIEDRIGKIEEKLTEVIKNIETLQKKLTEVEAMIPAEAIAKIVALTKRIETLESTGATDEEVKKAISDAKAELNATINTIPKISSKTLTNGNIELTFTVGASTTQKIEFVDPSQITISVKENNMTEITVGGKTFRFPTSVVVPTTINNIQVTTDPISADRMTSFTLKMWIGTSDGKQVELTAGNLKITNALTKASFFDEVNNLKIISVTKNGTEVNEFNVVVKAMLQSVASNYSIEIMQNSNTQRSNAFNVTVTTFSPLTTSQFKSFEATDPFVNYDATKANRLGTTTIDTFTAANEVKDIEIKYFNQAGAGVALSLFDITSVNAYEILGATSYEDAVTKTTLTTSVLLKTDDLLAYETKTANIANNQTKFKPYTGCSLVDSKGTIGFTTPSYDAINPTATRYYVVLINGSVSVDDVPIRQYGIIEVKSAVKFRLLAATFAAETTATFVEVTNAHPCGKTYIELTGLADVDASKIMATIVDNEGKLIVGGVTLYNAALNGTGNLKYNIVPVQSKLKAGEYTVTVTNEFAPGKLLISTMPVTITREAVNIMNSSTLGAGYSASGTFDSFVVNPLTKNFTFASVVTPVSSLTATDYKVFYRLYTETAGVKSYLDGKTVTQAEDDYLFTDSPSTTLMAAETKAINTMVYDIPYNVDAQVIYKSGFVQTGATSFIFKYATLPKINGF